MTRPSIAIAFVVLAACGGSEKPKDTTTNKMTSSTTDDTHALCVSGFQRQRECTDTFIPALVAARVAADKPPGIAAKDAEIGRDALVATAMEEWKTDSTDEAIDANCTSLLAEHAPSPEQIEAMKGCMAQTECQAFTDCTLQVVGPHQ
jgi:hypothetical protein